MTSTVVIGLVVVVACGLGGFLLLTRVFPPPPPAGLTGKSGSSSRNRGDARPDLGTEFDARLGGYDPRQDHWNPHASGRSTRARPEITYRPEARGTAPKWDPYESGQSIRERIREARHHPRRSRPADDYYTLLGLDHSASDREILRAYRKHAAQIHPDKFFDDPERRHLAEEKLTQLNLAMQVLRDPQRRALYDGSLGYRSNSPRWDSPSDE
jgi:hypothetical protein